MLHAAFRVRDYQLVAPQWARDVRVDVDAILPPGRSRADVPEMLQDLLRRRFGAEWHTCHGAHELLVGSEGISMREAPPLDEFSAEPPGDAIAAVTSESLDGPYRIFATRPGVTVATPTTRYTQSATAGGPSTLDAKRMTMDELAEVLQFTMDAPVFNRTGLSGGYEFTIDLPRPATAVRLMINSGMTTTYEGTPIDCGSGGISAADAVKKLGRRLERIRTPVDVFVIDRLERVPTEN